MSETLTAWQLIASGDATLFAIVGLSLAVSLTAVVAAGIIGFPLGAILALTRFPGRTAMVVVLNGFMGLPPVVVGLSVYLLLSRSGPLGELGLLFYADRHGYRAGISGAAHHCRADAPDS